MQVAAAARTALPGRSQHLLWLWRNPRRQPGRPAFPKLIKQQISQRITPANLQI
jgi:hypothetical protein